MGKLAIPVVWEAKKAMIKGESLLLQKPKLEALFKRLNATQTNL